MQANAAATDDTVLAVQDLGPLAWVLDELRKSLDSATKAMRRFVRDAELARGSELEALDASQLRIARQQLHQAVGALEMVGLSAPAKVLRAMEALAQKFVQRPELCSDDAASKVERASFALTEYLEGVLKGKTASSVALFPQYRDVIELVGGERVHPADLWVCEWRWIDVELPLQSAPVAYDAPTRARADQAVLKVVKSGDASAARTMREISLGFAAAQTALEARVFWKVCAAYFEALALGLCPPDVYVKRAASRVLLQYTTLARGDQTVSDRLVQDLLFFCAQALPPDATQAPVLFVVRQAYGLFGQQAVDYETPQFGRFDPAILVQARKRIAAATETWSALAGGDTNRLKVAADQFSLVSDSILKLHPECGELARALTRAVETAVRSGQSPSTPLAMEVATAVLYLEAAYDDLDPTESQMAERSARLARRLDHVIAGGQPEALEGWMEELYRKVSDHQTMGSVVDELRITLGGVEAALDRFFRSPQDKVPLHEVPSQLAQMRGVFSVLGLDQASLATLRMRDTVEKFLLDEPLESTDRSVAFEKLGNSLGALGFLIDMLSYQRSLAKNLFVYDEALGEFKPLMGRHKAALPEPLLQPQDTLPMEAGRVVPVPPLLAQEPAAPSLTPPARAVPPVTQPDDDEAELRDIFLEEAREVVVNGLEAVKALGANPADLGQQTTLRRAFHTLKGSSRMVALNEFGEAAWSLEQLLNTRLAEQLPATEGLIRLSADALQGFGRWVEDIAAGTDGPWSAQVFRDAADSLRENNQLIALNLPGDALAADLDFPEAQAAPADALAVAPAPALNQEELAATVALTEPVTLDLDDIDFADLFEAPMPAPAEPVVPFAEDDTELPDIELEFEEVARLPQEPSGLAALPEVDLVLDGEPVLDDEVAPETPAAKEDIVASASEAATEPAAETFDEQFPVLEFDGVGFEPAAAAVAAEPGLLAGTVTAETPESDEQIKVIGSLRIGIPLYNVFLNEADEWSRRLLTELTEWAMELHRPVFDSTVALAHSLSGSSATVGFQALSDIARALEQALQHVQLHAEGSPDQLAVFVSAAEDIRHLLHQFAAGFLKEPNRQVLDALKDILEMAFPAVSSAVPESPLAEPVDDPDEEFFELANEPVSVAVPPATFAPSSVAGVIQAAQAPSHLGAQDDDIDVVDALDEDLFPIFEEEALELLPKLGGALRQWTEKPDHQGARTEMLRVLHTLKGSARLAGAMRLGEMAHHMESAIEQLGTEFLQLPQIEPLLARFDALQANFDALRTTPAKSVIGSATAVHDAVTPSDASPAPTTGRVLAFPAAEMPGGGSRAVLRQPAGQSVRVRSHLLDRLVNQAGEVMITRSRLDARLGQMRGSLGDLTGNLDRLRHHLRDIEVQAESQMQSRLALAKDTAQGFDPLEFDRFTRVQELTRMMAESVNDVATVQRNLQRTIEGTEDDLIAQARQARELQRDLLRTRMVEFESISERLYGVVRQASKDAGKLVKLDISGGSLEMDRGVLDRMAPAFEHMLRNAVAHGIEAPALREAAGKPPAGTITISLHQESNDVSVVFSDDGAGLNLQRIRDKAWANSLIPAGSHLSDAQVAELIFTPGFSTASEVTELSGRGIGMDVVRAEVNALGGRIETSTQSGQGTRFKLVLPLTTAVTQVVMLRSGALTLGVPANVVETVRRVSQAELEQAYQSGVVDVAGEAVPFFWAGALLQASSHSLETHGKTLPLVIFRSAGQRVAAHVDEVLGNQEVVVKNLGPQLSRLPGLTGMSVLASGAVVLIYNPVALATVYGDKARELRLAAVQAGLPTMGDSASAALAMAVNQLPLVLVVDDSITVRRVTQRLLRREGYRVVSAADGLQALELLQEERPAVVLSDIEMPRMDGFDLARNIRADEKLRDIPIIMITSRIAEKHREHARELGVNHYLGKPYSEDELLSLVQHYCAVEVAV
jgi:chemosensory pili system protein ChpA (sensor histidine kinase/response regulator)